MWKSESGKVFFVIIGILFVMISLAVSTNVIEMDKEIAESRQEDGNVKGAHDAFLAFISDMANAINYAAMDALQQMGETPVIDPDPNSQYNPGGSQIDVAEFNKNWAKGMTMDHINNYIGDFLLFSDYTY